MSVNTSEEYLDELLQAIEPIIGNDKQEDLPQEEVAETVDDNADMNELLAALSEEASKEAEQLDDKPKSQHDLEWNAGLNEEMDVMPQGQENTAGAEEEDADVKALLEQFTSEDGFAEIEEIQEIPSISDLIQEEPESEREEAQIEEPRLEESVEEEKDTHKKKRERLHLFKKKKDKKGKEESIAENEDGIAENVQQEPAQLQDADSLSEMDLLSGLMGEDAAIVTEDTEMGVGVEELSLDDLFASGDTMDIDALLSAGSFEGNNGGEESSHDPVLSSGEEKKVSLFSKIISLLTEEDEEDETETRSKRASVPESAETGITDENQMILEELSKEEKKKRKKEEKERKKKEKEDKKKNKGKNSDASEDENEENSDKKEDAKKKKKKKEKPRKVEDIDEKPAKKISKKKIFIVFAFCFSILAMILILQTVLLDVSNGKEARWAFDNADYETCYANLYGVDRNDEEEILFQRSYIILCLQRKWDSYQNLKQMDMDIEALDALFEGIRVYREDMETKAESYDIVNRITPIYDTIYNELGTYGLSDADIEEILAYESKVSYTKRLESIIKGTPFVENDWLTEEEESVADENAGAGSEVVMTSGEINVTEPLDDILPMEEDFLPEDGILTEQDSRNGEMTEEAIQELPEEKVVHTTTVVGSSPVNISDSVQ